MHVATWFALVVLILARFTAAPVVGSAGVGVPATPVGIFEGHGDIGTVQRAGAAAYDAASRTYTVSGSGENMWAAADAFHFVWTPMSGDLTLAADVSLKGTGTEEHRKAVLMVRQSLDAGAAYVDVALHGNGLTSLQFRDHTGDATHEVQANVSAPARLRIEKRGKYVLMSLGTTGGSPRFSGAAVRIAFDGPFYVGLGVCAHNANETETAVFSNVELTRQTPPTTVAPVLYSTLETQSTASTDRRVVFVTPTRIEAPTWLADGHTLTFNSAGRIFSVLMTGGEPVPVDTAASTQPAKPFVHPSPDGRFLVFLSYEPSVAGHPPDTDVTLRRMTLPGRTIDVLGRFLGGQGTLGTPCWSPDGRQIAFVTYQVIK